MEFIKTKTAYGLIRYIKVAKVDTIEKHEEGDILFIDSRGNTEYHCLNKEGKFCHVEEAEIIDFGS